MAQLTFTIPDNQVSRVLNGYAPEYQPNLLDSEGNIIGPNPETHTQFLKRKIANHVKVTVRQSELAVQLALDKQEAENTITEVTVT